MPCCSEGTWLTIVTLYNSLRTPTVRLASGVYVLASTALALSCFLLQMFLLLDPFPSPLSICVSLSFSPSCYLTSTSSCRKSLCTYTEVIWYLSHAVTSGVLLVGEIVVFHVLRGLACLALCVRCVRVSLALWFFSSYKVWVFGLQS